MTYAQHGEIFFEWQAHFGSAPKKFRELFQLLTYKLRKSFFYKRSNQWRSILSKFLRIIFRMAALLPILMQSPFFVNKLFLPKSLYKNIHESL